MGFSGKGTIVVGDKGEYGRRLARYLENRIPADMHLRRCTCAESFASFKEAECYLLEAGFYESLPDAMRGFLEGKKMLRISSEEGEGVFCRYHNPRELLDFILGTRGCSASYQEGECRLGKEGATVREGETYGTSCAPRGDESAGSGALAGKSEDGVKLTALYSPVYERELLAIAQRFMPEGSLYLGMEDLGTGGSGDSDMGDLCYYIHLREPHILTILDELVRRQGSVSLIASPDMYFYLKELTAEDYRWFFDKLRTESEYREIVAGVGNGFLSCPESLSYFDRVILVDSESDIRQNSFCGKLEKILKEGDFYGGTVERVCREALLNEDTGKARA